MKECLSQVELPKVQYSSAQHDCFGSLGYGALITWNGLRLQEADIEVEMFPVK
jgi:hypothetical protein